MRRSRAASARWSLPSGQAAETFAILNLTQAGHHIVQHGLYGGTYNLFHYTLPNLGIEVRFVDASDPQNYAAVIDDNTRRCTARLSATRDSIRGHPRAWRRSPTPTACR